MTQGSEKRARRHHLTIRLTVCERMLIDSAAERAGLTAGSFARQAIVGAPTPRQVRRPPIERQELARLLGALGAVGNNINQIAHTANSGEEVDHLDLAAALSELAKVRDAILEALGRAP